MRVVVFPGHHRSLRAKLSGRPSFATTTGAQQAASDPTLERFVAVETDLDRSLKAVKGTHSRRGHGKAGAAGEH